jgi:hypothetical protein
VWLYDTNSRGRPPLRGEIVHVGTQLVTIAPVIRLPNGEERVRTKDQCRADDKYWIANQHWNNKDFSSHHWFRTDEQRAEAEAKGEVVEYLHGIGVRFETVYGCKVDFADQVKVMELLKELGYEPESKA